MEADNMELTKRTAQRLEICNRFLKDMKTSEGIIACKTEIDTIINFKNELKKIIQKIAKDTENKYGIKPILDLIQEIERKNVK